MKERDIRRLLLVIVCGLIPLSGLLGPGSVKAQGSGALDLVLLIDSSGSVESTDPEGFRVDAAYFLLDYAQAIGETQGITHRFAAANFSDTTSDEIGWTPLEGEAADGLLIESSTGGTSFVSALEYAVSQLAESPEAHSKAVIIFTDGDPDPAEPDLATHFARDVAPQMEELPPDAQVYVVAIGVSEEAEREWKTLLPPNHYYAVKEDISELDSFYHAILTDLLGLTPRPVRALEPDSEQVITLEPYLEQAVFAITKQDLGVRVAVQDPLGNAREPDQGGPEERHEIFVFGNPASGQWRVRAGDGTAQVWVDRRLPLLHLEGPSEPQALGNPIALSGWLVWRGQVVNDPDLSLAIEAVPPSGESTTTPMHRQSQGRYTVSLDDLRAEATYTVTLASARLLTQTVSAQTEPITVSVYPVPKVIATDVEGDSFVSRAVTVTASIAHADRIDPQGTTVLLEVKNAAGDIEKTVEDVAEIAEGVFGGSVVLPAEPGRYQFEWVLEGRTRDGVAFEAPPVVQQLTVQEVPITAEVTPTLGPTRTPTVTPMSTLTPPDQPGVIERHPWLSVIAAGVLTVLAAGGIGFVVYRGEQRRAQDLAEELSSLKERQTEVLEVLEIDEPEQLVDRLRNTIAKHQERVESFSEQARRAEQRWESEKKPTEEIRERLRDAYREARALSGDPLQQEKLREVCDEALEHVEFYEEGQVESIVEDVEKILKIRIEEASENEGDELRQICQEAAGKQGTGRLKALSIYLLGDRWSESVEQALRELYHILQKGGAWKLLSLILSADLGGEAEEPTAGQERQRNVQALSKAISDVLSPSERRFTQDMEDIVACTRDAFDDLSAATDGIPGFEDGHQLWAYLSELTEQLQDAAVVIPIAEPPGLSESALDIWQEILDHAKIAFRVRPKDPWLQALDELEQCGRDLYGPARRLPEGRVLIALARGWRDKIKAQDSGSAEITLKLVPVLSIDEVSEGETYFAVQLTNGGEGPASFVKVSVTQGTSDIFTQGFKSLRSGQMAATDRIVIQGDDAAIHAKATYIEFAGGQRETSKYEFLIADSEKLPDSEAVLDNPYVREDRPLRKGEPFVGEHRMTVLQEIERRIQDEPGMVDNLWGIRRIGKTSLIYRLLDDVREGTVACVPIYMKATIFSRREIPWSSEDFLMALARIIEKRMVEEGVLTLCGLWKHCFEGGRFSTGSGDKFNAHKAFQEDFIHDILKHLQEQERKLLLIFDDADVFGERLYSKDERQFSKEEFSEVLETLHGLAYPPPTNPQGFFVMFATDTSVRKLWRGEVKVSGRDTRVGMLERDEVKHLLGWGGAPIRYSELAEEYFWQVTGGHPGLAQLICGNVVEERAKEESQYNGARIIPLTLVRKVVRDLTENVHLWGYYRYVYHYSIPENARGTMKRLLQGGYIDPTTLQIDGSLLSEQDSRDASNLRNHVSDQQIISRDPLRKDGWVLRVGFFYLGRDAWLDGWWGLEN